MLLGKWKKCDLSESDEELLKDEPTLPVIASRHVMQKRYNEMVTKGKVRDVKVESLIERVNWIERKTERLIVDVEELQNDFVRAVTSVQNMVTEMKSLICEKSKNVKR